jgi:hypothetical protein
MAVVMWGIEQMRLLAGQPMDHDSNIGNRVVLTAAIVVAVIILLAMFGYFTGGWDAPPNAN